MDSFFVKLKSAREAKGISLAQIADITLINTKMLEALERGEVDAVPQAYIRAFLREYATVVDVDPASAMRDYDAWLSSEKETSSGQLIRTDAAPPTTDEPTKKSRQERIELVIPTVFKIGVAIVVLVLIDIVLWTVLEKSPVQPVKETAFNVLVQENERRAGIIDSSAHLAEDETSDMIAPTDSLRLVAATTDSVWLQIVIDDSIQREYLLSPHTTFTWKAKKDFQLVAIGNPTAITFSLNNKTLQLPIKRGFVTRNIRLGRDSIRSR